MLHEKRRDILSLLETTVLYIVKAGEMHRDGFKFYLSKNGVWLTKKVPEKYLVKLGRKCKK